MLQKLLVVSLALLLVGLLTPVALAQGPTTVQVTQQPDLGAILTDAQGKTLYLFTKDAENVSNCYDQCATAWPPLLVAEGEKPTAGEGATGTLETIERTDGTYQVAYNGMPLYYYAKDTEAGQATGQDVGGVWFVVHPDISTMTVKSPVIQISQHPELGEILTTQGMTLYLYTKDGENVTRCYDQCAVNWPPVLVPEGGDPVAGEGLTGELSVVERTDGSRQVTYNRMPLYYWIKDSHPWQATGQNVGGVWYVVHPDISKMAVSNSPLVEVTENPKLGPILTNQGMTLYLYTKDEQNVTNCYDKCAVAWPPLLAAEGQQPTAGKEVTGTLGTIERTDGTYQVTYDGIPLYFWFKDRRPGETTGQNVGGVWFVVPPGQAQK
jgi:predicted lipoprotein with Yx(FWY)xxD motif